MDGRVAKMSHFSFSGIHHMGMELLVLSTSPLIFPGCCELSGRDPQIPRSQKGQRGQEEQSLVLSWPPGQAGQGTGRGVGRGIKDALQRSWLSCSTSWSLDGFACSNVAKINMQVEGSFPLEGVE